MAKSIVYGVKTVPTSYGNRILSKSGMYINVVIVTY